MRSGLRSSRKSAPARLERLADAFDDLFAAQRRLRGRDAKVVDGISLAQLRLLRILARDGPLPLGHLATAAAVNSSSATQMLDGLERRGLVARRRSRDDRRVVRIALTAEGDLRAENRRRQSRRQLERVFADLSEEEVDLGIDVLRRCARYLDAL